MIKEQRKRILIEDRRRPIAMPQLRLLGWARNNTAASDGGTRRVRTSWSEAVKMKTILLVDHNSEHLRLHGDLLGRAGYRIVTAQDAGSALFIIESGMILDLIVTEYTMPDMESRKFLAAVRMEAPTVPVIVVTSCESVDCYLEAINLGVYEYLNKPLLPGELHNIIRTAARARRSGNLPAGLA